MKLKSRIRVTIIVLFTFFILGLPLDILYVLNNGNPYTKFLVNKYVPKYLEGNGIKDEDLITGHYVEPSYLINKAVYHGHYEVIFKDEPQTSYYYGVIRKGKNVIQFCEKDVDLPDGSTETSTEKLKHGEKNCLFSFDNRF
jgi:hypothetical protein